MDLVVQQYFNLEIMLKVWPLLLRGLGTTAMLCLFVVPLGIVGGLAISLASLSPQRSVRWSAIALIDFFRAAPPLVMLILLYSGLPFAGIESVGAGQWEAARSTGLTSTVTFLHVVMPQAVRNVLPDLVSNTIEVVKLTSIASVVSFPELLYSADMARSLTYNASPVVLAAAIYLAILWPLIRLAGRLERRVAG